ncbi:DUF5640 domain-containing protein [Parabacteroides goldsteinii]|uniref:DUF5640 domain-containing protein n=1 Tax=Parabacteroides goldsteinii TaxID=328812 RepID=UPI00241D4FC0|nr:DUF5640 domain-containing protein [Parabacteroides goldsteinii]
MKTMKYLSMLLMMLTMSVCMLSCGDDDDESNTGDDSIVGTWVRTGSSTNVTTYQFSSDGTGTITDDSGTRNIKYTYSVSSTSKILQLWYVTSTTIYEYSVQRTGNTLMLENGNGKIIILEKK